jgi:hypothetical protein
MVSGLGLILRGLRFRAKDLGLRVQGPGCGV